MKIKIAIGCALCNGVECWIDVRVSLYRHGDRGSEPLFTTIEVPTSAILEALPEGWRSLEGVTGWSHDEFACPAH